MTESITQDQAVSLLEALEQAGGIEPVQPDVLSAQEAKALLLRQREQEAAQLHKFVKRYDYAPMDGAVAMHRVLMRMFGTAGQGQTTYSMFSVNQPELTDVAVSLTETIQVPYGDTEVAFPIFGEGAYFRNHARATSEGVVYELRFTAQKRFAAHIRGLQKEVQKELDTNSIYRGKAFNGAFQFINIDSVDPNKVIYSAETTEAIEADLWSLVENSDVLRKIGIPLKHAVLLPGEYGTGKTLLGAVTGQKAVANGWTFLQSRPGRDNYARVMHLARLYQPCVVFFEDIDTFSSTGEDDELARLLEIYDGATAKGAEIVAVFTTNHPERIHKGMIRPGRIDAVIPIGKQDKASLRRMIETSVDSGVVDDLDYDEIAEQMDGFTPAFVKEAIHRAVRHAVARVGGEPSTYVTADFVNAAKSMHAHLKMMEDATEGARTPAFASALADLVRDALVGRVRVDASNDLLVVGAGEE